MKLSEIKDQLERCAELGAFKITKTKMAWYFHIPKISIFPRVAEDEDSSIDSQALIIAALEQFAESKKIKDKSGLMKFKFEFLFDFDNGLMERVTLNKIRLDHEGKLLTVKTVADKNAATRLEAALDCFLKVFGK